MAAAAYSAITAAVKARLETSLAGLTPIPIVVAEEPYAANESWVGVYATDRQTPQNIQALAMGTKLGVLLRFEVTCWRFAMSRAEAQALRDALLGQAELALMVDRTFGATVTASWLEGGRMFEDQRGSQFFAGADIVLVTDTFARV